MSLMTTNKAALDIAGENTDAIEAIVSENGTQDTEIEAL